MIRIIWIFGSIGGVILVLSLALTMTLSTHGGAIGMIVGYLSMLVALSVVFVGVKRYRDIELGGAIAFWTALYLGLGIAFVSSLFYVFGWEVYMYMTDYRFMDEYIKSYLVQKQSEGLAAAQLSKISAELYGFKQQYANLWFRLLTSLSEIAPIVILVALVSAALLRKSNFMPARR